MDKKAIDWKKEIPRITQPDGTVLYDCDIFGGDCVDFNEIRPLRITGNLSVGNHFTAKDIYIGGSAFFGDYADIYYDIIVAKDLFFGDHCYIGDITVSGTICAGKDIETGDIDCGGDISFDDYADICDVCSSGNVSFGDNADTAVVDAYGSIIFGDNAVTYEVSSAIGTVCLGSNHTFHK